MSAGIRSGVSWTRWKSAAIACAIVVATSVLATPGTPSSSTWPQPVPLPVRRVANGLAGDSGRRQASAVDIPVVCRGLPPDELALAPDDGVDGRRHLGPARRADVPAAGGLCKPPAG